VFESKANFKEHYKSEWHLENTKRKMSGKPKLTEQEFQQFREEELDKEMFLKNNKNKDKGKKKKGKNR